MISRVELRESGNRSVIGGRRSIAAAAHPVGWRVPRRRCPHRRRGPRVNRRIPPGFATASVAEENVASKRAFGHENDICHFYARNLLADFDGI